MNKLIPLEFENQRIMTTKVLAEEFGTNEDNIKTNFNRNKERFIESKHYYKLEGQLLKEFKNSVTDSNLVGKNANSLTLWTDRGAARHAKILDTDEAWEVYEDLEETYFNVKENAQALNTSELSPELQMFNKIFQAVASVELNNKQLQGEIEVVKQANEKTKEELQGIRDIVALEPNQWRDDTKNLINKIAIKLGGFDYIKPVRDEAYKILDNNYGVSLKTRLLNKQKKMALEGTQKYKIDKANYLDVIAEDKKLINGYVNIVSKLAIKYGV